MIDITTATQTISMAHWLTTGAVVIASVITGYNWWTGACLCHYRIKGAETSSPRPQDPLKLRQRD